MLAGLRVRGRRRGAGPARPAVRRLVATGAVVGGGAGLALALAVFASGAPFVLEVPALLSIADGLVVPARRAGCLLSRPRRPRRHSVRPSTAPGTPRRYEGRYSLRLLGAMLNLFLLTMSLVPCAGNVLTFLLMWEGMSLTLVLPRPDRDGRAGHDPRGRLVPGHDARGAGARARGLPAPRRRRDTTALRRPARGGGRALAGDAQRRVPARAPGLRLQGGDHPAPRVAAARSSRRRRATSPR